MRELTDEWQFSFSQLQMYSGCSEKYRIMVMEEERPTRQPAAWLVHGNAYHEAVAEWHMTGRPDIFALYNHKFEEELQKQLEIQPDMNVWALTPRVKGAEQDLKLRKAAAVDQLQAYVLDYEKGLWDIAIFEGEPMIEISFEVQFGRHRVRGFLDQVREYKDGHPRVVDLKTGSEKGTDVRQLGLYGEAVRQLYGYDVQWGKFWYSKLDSVPKSGDKLGRYSTDYRLADFDSRYWLDEFTMMRTGVDAKVFLPNPSDNCRTCDALTLCRAKPYL